MMPLPSKKTTVEPNVKELVPHTYLMSSEEKHESLDLRENTNELTRHH